MFPLISQILAVIVVVTIALTLVIATFSYISYKLRQKRAPDSEPQIADFFWRYTPSGVGMAQPPQSSESSQPPTIYR